MPSSFNIVLSFTLVYSTYPPVSVSGTVYLLKKLFPEKFKIFVTFFKKFNLKIIPSKFAFVKSFLGAVSLYEIHLNIETLGFTVIMIYTLFFVTNASIFFSDIFNIFNNISLSTYRMFRYRFKNKNLPLR